MKISHYSHWLHLVTKLNSKHEKSSKHLLYVSMVIVKEHIWFVCDGRAVYGSITLGYGDFARKLDSF